jgi:hypothetical protein
MRKKDSLEYIIPEDMKLYLSNYGRHFNKKMYEFAVSNMYKSGGQKIQPVNKAILDNKMKQYGVVLENNTLYDGCYAWSMCEADYLGSAIPNEQYQVLFVKNLIDDPDAVDGQIFNRFYADMCLQGIPIDWEEMI